MDGVYTWWYIEGYFQKPLGVVDVMGIDALNGYGSGSAIFPD